MKRASERPRLGTEAAAVETSIQSDSTALDRPDQAPSEATPSPDQATDDLPPGNTTLAESLAKLVAILPRLADALDTQNRPEPLAFRKADAARLCSMSVREWERMRAAGKAPRPDAHAGKCPLWTRSTLEAWIARGGSK
ncbi:MAG: helix-turn-helix transcriptional regulator [Isosphaeraceae bacterium]